MTDRVYRITDLKFTEDGRVEVAFNLNKAAGGFKSELVEDELFKYTLKAWLKKASPSAKRPPTGKEYEFFYNKIAVPGDEELESFLREAKVQKYESLGLRVITDNGSGYWYNTLVILDRPDGASIIIARLSDWDS